MKKFNPKFDAKVLSRGQWNISALSYSALESTSIRFMLLWGTLYLSFIGFFIFVNRILNINNSLPYSFTSIVNSPWGGFSILSLLCSLLVTYYYPKSVDTDTMFAINSSQLTITNADLVLSVFCCRPPILHTKDDFSFFLTTFKPLSIEIKPTQQLIYIIVYGRNIDSFSTKIKECQNQLNSLFSTVTLLTHTDLKNFILNGYKLYHQKSSFLELYDFNALKSMRLKPIRPSNFLPNSQVSQPDSLATTNNTFDKPNVFLLMLSNFSTYDTSTATQQSTYFRGIRLGFDNNNPIVKNTNSKGINIKNIKNFFLAACRVPEKNTIHQDISEFDKIYFFVLHKYFNYYFSDDRVNENVKNNDINKEQKITSSSNTEPNINNSQSLDTKNDKIIQDQLPTKNSSKKVIQENNLGKTIIRTKAPKLNDIKKIVFQFTYFCQYFCPIMNNKFRNFSAGSKKDFTVPDGCYDHIKFANDNLVDFIEKQESDEPIELVFAHKKITERFFEFIQEKELKSIDKICHFSSIILLSPHKYEIKESDILNFIKNLEGDYFVT